MFTHRWRCFCITIVLMNGWSLLYFRCTARFVLILSDQYQSQSTINKQLLMVDAFFRQIITVIFISYRFFSKARALLFFFYILFRQILKSRYFYSVLFKTINIFSCNLEILYGKSKACPLEVQFVGCDRNSYCMTFLAFTFSLQKFLNSSFEFSGLWYGSFFLKGALSRCLLPHFRMLKYVFTSVETQK